MFFKHINKHSKPKVKKPVKMTEKNVRSRAYHRAERVAADQGLSKEKIAEVATKAGRDAVEAFLHPKDEQPDLVEGEDAD